MTCRALILAALGLISCTIPVNVGSLNTGAGGAAGGGGGGTGLQACGASGSARAYRVTLAETEVGDPGCWNGGMVPALHSLPEETFEVLIAALPAPNARSTLGVAGLSPQRLGDVAEVTVGEGVAGEGGFIWTQHDLVRGPAVDDPVQTRTTEAIFEFDRFDTAQTAGTLTLTSQYSCANGRPPRRAPCGPPPPDDGGCMAIRTFTAVPIGWPSRWSTLTTPLLEGATSLLVSLDLGALSSTQTRCGIIGQPAQTTRLTPRLRALDVWQVSSSTVRVVPRGYQLGDAPRIEVGLDFQAPPDNVQRLTVDTSPAIDIKEVRTTRAELPPRVCGYYLGSPEEPQVLKLESSYDCSGAGCALDQNGNPVRSFCQLDLQWFAIPFGWVMSE